jgi:hypothetical protein
LSTRTNLSNCVFLIILCRNLRRPLC